jgi:hypothetical protein
VPWRAGFSIPTPVFQSCKNASWYRRDIVWKS